MAGTRKDARGYKLNTGEYQRKDGRYVYSYTDKRRGVRHSVTADSLAELRKRERKIIRDIEDGIDPTLAERLTLNELYDKYISEKYDLKPTTKAGYIYAYNHYVRNSLGTKKIKSIRYSDVKRFYYELIRERNLKAYTLDNIHKQIHPAFRMAVRDGLLRSNPSDEVADAFLKEYEIQKCLSLRSETIDGFTNFVFLTWGGVVITANHGNRAIKRIIKAHNEKEKEKAEKEGRDPVLLPDFTAHNLRHTFCTRLCENETNLKVIQSIMGHADISTTMNIYAEATDDKKQEIVANLQGKIII